MGSDKLWSAFCRAIERPDLLENEGYASNAKRILNRSELEPLLEAVFVKRNALATKRVIFQS
jgi:crotonobetainyl-CoA:carnitine CoA-transferase CaiB-like acyl-CoA transferase